ncbi:hypothetical protein Palpr_0428 [Paludibacter propionicigenes WB4]|uniref:Uncharacterized protein n=1 Tax=Paludibacter propionicigenes (strain DSM 17365 / JCM 13257 / WB4) TaxID=694427 RepID=E4T1J4_PALPW|nr:hypothetical protein Palpr_0428 [Paludibacter propionicigenes WB4]
MNYSKLFITTCDKIKKNKYELKKLSDNFIQTSTRRFQ